MENNGNITQTQRAAIDHITSLAANLRDEALSTMAHIMRMSDLPNSTTAEVLGIIRRHARVVVHFHPDRIAKDGRSVAQSLLDTGKYRSQFETGISNGSVSAYTGGERDEWERRLFGSAYHAVPNPAERPKYGALDLMRCSDGPAPRFGSCFFIFKPEVAERSTFTYGGSQDDPKFRGTVRAFEAVLGALLEESFIRDTCLGQSHVRPTDVVERLMKLSEPYAKSGYHPPSRNLDHVVEAQVHGELDLRRDVETLVVDPSFQGTDTLRYMEAMCTRYDIAMRFHGGFCIQAEDVPRNFRGATMPSLAMRIAKEGVVNAAIVGNAAQDLLSNPDKWRDRGSDAEVLQELKLLWHVLVRFGGSQRK